MREDEEEHYFCDSFLRAHTEDRRERLVELFWGREGALSLFDLLSYKNTKREERVLTNEFVTKLSRFLATR